MRQTDLTILHELRKWSTHPIPWVYRHVLKELVGIPERDFAPALQRLLALHLIEHEHRVGFRGGAYRTSPGWYCRCPTPRSRWNGIEVQACGTCGSRRPRNLAPPQP